MQRDIKKNESHTEKEATNRRQAEKGTVLRKDEKHSGEGDEGQRGPFVLKIFPGLWFREVSGDYFTSTMFQMVYSKS